MTGEKETVLRWLQDQPAGRYECNKAKRKRTLTQNSYYWALLSELAGALGLSNDELHFQLLKRYSTPQPFVTFKNVDVSKFMRYYEKRAENDRCISYLFYTPSSEMSTKEFKRLLDGLISECQEVGINTLSANELALLKEGKQ